MTEHPAGNQAPAEDDPRVVVIGPGGMAVSGGSEEQQADDERHVTDLV